MALIPTRRTIVTTHTIGEESPFPAVVLSLPPSCAHGEGTRLERIFAVAVETDAKLGCQFRKPGRTMRWIYTEPSSRFAFGYEGDEEDWKCFVRVRAARA